MATSPLLTCSHGPDVLRNSCAMESSGPQYRRRRCRSESFEQDSSSHSYFEQSYSAETQRPLSRLPSHLARGRDVHHHQAEAHCSFSKVRLPSPGRRPFHCVNASDLRYFNGSLSKEQDITFCKSEKLPDFKRTLAPKVSNHINHTNGYSNGGEINGGSRNKSYSSHHFIRRDSSLSTNGHCGGLDRPFSHLTRDDFKNRNGHHAEEKYLQEIETLRSKLHGLEHLHGLYDGKRSRQRSDSDVSSAATSPPNMHAPHKIKKEAKRAREANCHESHEDFHNNSVPIQPEAASSGQIPLVDQIMNGVAQPQKVETKVKKVREYPGPHSLDGLRPSLFSHVPPFIKFSLHDQKGPALPPPIQRCLKWNLSTITPVVVRRTVVNSGYRLIRKSNEWTGTWGKHMKSLNFKVLKDYQKINHFPGTFQIGRKDRLWRNLFKLMSKFGKKEFGFIPKTYVLPQDNKMLRAAWERSNSKEAWIIKPPASARGTGIKVIHRWGQIPKKRPLVVQKYVDRPYLINGCKFDLRLYIVVTSIHPLRIYLYDDGLVRFASVKYSEDPASLADRYMHLTNYSINKLSSHYTQNEDESACKGHKWTIKSLWKYMQQNGVDVDSLWERLIDLSIKTVISGESSINQLTRAHLNSRYCCYEIFGIDVLLDEDLKPWLLEVNISPSLHSSSPLDLAVKGPMVRDLMNMVGHQVPCKLTPVVQEEISQQYNRPDLSILCLDKRLYTVVLSSEERSKHILHQQSSSREEYLSTILNDLTADDVRHLIQYEDELTQCGRFQKIFPTPYSHEYHQFFESPRYYNMLLDAWETKYHSNRQEGIQRLEELCVHKLHLQVPTPNSRSKCCTNQPNMEVGMKVPVEVGNSNTTSALDHTTTKAPKKRAMSPKDVSPVTSQSPKNSNLQLWSSARIKLSAARLRSHKVLTQRNRPSAYLSRFTCAKHLSEDLRHIPTGS